MVKAIVIGIVGLILGMLLLSYVILPMASDLLAKPEIASFTGVGFALHSLGILVLGALYFIYIRNVVRSGRSNE